MPMIFFFKEKGNEYVKMGKKHYSDAIECYTRAINQDALSDSDNSIVYSNRAHVNLLLGNYRRALTDAQEAIKLCPTNVKVVLYLLLLLLFFIFYFFISSPSLACFIFWKLL
jgi:tetratricopeptide (TPR) repeat protein